jgi:dTDP-4-dehydrorhamnose reductase
MRWLITGARGQLGSDLVGLLEQSPEDVRAVGSAELDVTDSAAVEAAVADFAPDVIVNAAAYTAVDAAETDEERAYAVNATAPGFLAASAARHGARLIHVSTDYVFAGDAESPYPVDAPPAPQSAYGRTKLAGELAVGAMAPDTGYVVRTAWVYGATGGNFVKTMARLEKSNETVSVVDDQRGSPTYAADLAAGLIELGRSAAPAGTYHYTNSGDTTWYGFTQAIFAGIGADPARVLPTDSAAFVRPAPRPAYSVLSGTAWLEAGLSAPRSWHEALTAALAAGLLD